jgi:hypothetical protein
MPIIKIAVINQSTVLTDAQVAAAVGPLQTQVSRDFAPVWGVDADLTFYARGTAPPATAWQLGVFDNSDQAGALGYHDLTADGLPLGKVFAGTDIQYKSAWTVTASHELLEMLGDPDINLYAVCQNGMELSFYAYEVCDPCEADESGYLVDGVLVSDFVYPAWFEGFRAAKSTRFDQQGLVSNPFELLNNGYITVFDVSYNNGWYQKYPPGAALKYQARAHVGSRRERRGTPRNQWLKSR